MPDGGADRFSASTEILTAQDEPIELSGLFLEAKDSIGISLHPGHGTDPDALLRRVRIALERA